MTHKFKIGEIVDFRFAGKSRVGHVIERTREDNRHATYTVESNGVIYPCLGLENSKQVGNIISHHSK